MYCYLFLSEVEGSCFVQLLLLFNQDFILLLRGKE